MTSHGTDVNKEVMNVKATEREEEWVRERV